MEARAHFDRAESWIPLPAPRAPSTVPLLSDHALFLSELGELDEAERLIHRALVQAEGTSSKSAMLENVLSRLSTIQLRGGDLAESVETAWRSYDAALRRTGPEGVATLLARVRLHNRLLEFEDYRGALAEQRDLLPRLTRTFGDAHPTTIGVRLSYAEVLLLLGATDSARVHVSLAREAMRRQPPAASSNTLYAPMLESRLAREANDFASARARLLDPLAIARAFDPTGDRDATLLVEYLNAIRTPADSLALRFALAHSDTLADSTAIARKPAWAFVLAARARAERRAGWHERAWRDALEADERAFAGFLQQVRALPDARALQLVGRHAEAVDGVVATAPDEGPSSALRTWERVARWRTLVRDEIARRRPVAGAADTAITGSHARWVAARRRLARLAVSGAAHPDDPETRARWMAASADAENAERAFARLARGAVLRARDDAKAERRSGPPRREALVGFAIATTTWTLVAFVYRAADPVVRRIELGPAERIRAALADWTERLGVVPGPRARRDEALARELGARVRDLVWTPVARALGAERAVFLVPASPIEELPWLALPAPNDRYLADDPRTLHVLASEADVARSRAAPPTSGLLAIGDPEFATVRPGAKSDSLRGGRLGEPCLRAVPPLGSLPGTREEARAIAARWSEGGDVRVLIGAEAREADVKRFAPGRRVLHLATHGIVIGDDCDAALATSPGVRGVGGVSPVVAKPKRAAERPRPEPAAASPWLGRRVWLALAGANAKADSSEDENDGLLTAEEVSTLDLRDTDWVVLSACQSGAPEGWSREGVLGVRRAFHLAGANAVIASRWPVSDDATRAWMLALYAARAHTHSASEAVREASRAVLADRRARRASTHPFWWAAFAASGD